jgi:phage/plasmid-associated DNA primase
MSKRKAADLYASDFTDAMLADRVAPEVLRRRFRWVNGLGGWLRWDGTRWTACEDTVVVEAVRNWVLAEFAALSDMVRKGQADGDVLKKWLPVLGRTKIGAIVALTRGIDGVIARAEDFDADRDVLNTPAGVVDLRTGELRPHNPELLITKITKGRYRPGYRHPDWQAATSALDEPARTAFRNRIGQGITGHPTPDGVAPILHGTGENGKGALTTDGLLPALGDYAAAASPKLILGNGNEHSTERADLRGQRLLVAEEVTEQRAIDVAALKRIMDVGRIRARYVHRDNIEFAATHSLFVTTNYVPVVSETDHGTWRRLALFTFPYRYVTRSSPGTWCVTAGA